MLKYEYKIVEAPGPSSTLPSATVQANFLCEHGAEGWEVCAVINRCSAYVLKRLINSEQSTECFFVVSSSEEPERIFFTKEDAYVTKANYIDSFDAKGMRVAGYKWVDGTYTTEF
jgi:hypothetical protein